MNSIDLAVGALAATLRLVAGTSVTIRRGGEKSDPITATLTVATHEIVDDSGILLRVKSHDWVIERSLLVIAGKAITLRPGDELLTESGRYEVMPLGTQRPAVEPHDAAGSMVIVHTKDLSCPD